MKVKEVLRHYSKASAGNVEIRLENGNHTFSFDGINSLIENNAPILSKTVGLILVKDNNLIITAHS